MIFMMESMHVVVFSVDKKKKKGNLENVTKKIQGMKWTKMYKNSEELERY